MATCLVLLRLLFSLLVIWGSAVQIHGVELGINYGQIANDLPSPTLAAVLLQSLNVHRVKLFDADLNVLIAFSNSNIELTIGLGNEDIQKMTVPTEAENWIQQNVQPHIPQTKITCIAVGNEVFSSNDAQLMFNLLPAMKMIHNTLVNLGLDKQVMISTPHSFNILENSYPPSCGTFREDLAEYIKPLLSFLSQIKSPFFINAYPFFAYKADPTQISLDYVLFQPNKGMKDPNTNLLYDNMLYAQVDAVYSAMKTMGHTDIEVKISETGWPSKGDPDEVGSTPENARLYHSNLLKRIQEKQGTPAKPSVPIEAYVSALFNEDLRTGPTSERNYGLFYPDCSPVYNIGLQDHFPTNGVVYSSASSNINALSVFSLLIFVMAYVILA
ncbi:hypothetical protein Peur_015910 [Populus x canadensis]